MSIEQLDSESVFITGGTGFIGSHLRNQLAESGSKVTIFARANSPVETKPNESVVRGNVTELETISVEDHNMVIHLAAQTSVEKAVESPVETWETNATGTLNVLEAARRADVNQFLYASTASVYGRPTYLPIDEEHPRNPIEPYGASKLAGDQLARTYHHTYGLPTVVARFFNVFGPDQPQHNVIPAIIEQGMTKDNVDLGNLTPTRDFIYVADAIRGLITTLTDGEPGNAYNIGAGREVQISELAEKVVETLNTSPTITSTSDRQRDESIEIPRHFADISRSRSLGWAPDYDLKQGLRETIEEFG